MEVDEEAIDLSNACGFSSSFLTRWLKSNGPQSPTTLCQTGLTLTLPPAVTRLLSGMNVCAHTAGLAPHKYETNPLSYNVGVRLNCLRADACSSALI